MVADADRRRDFYQRAHGEPIELSNGSTLFATYWSPRGFQKLRGAIHRSDDSGKTWGLVSIVGADDRVIDEPEISLLPSGRLSLITRPDGAIFYSEDEGKTWRYSHTPFPKGARVKTPRFKMLSDGTLVCVMTAYGQLRLSWSTDEGKT
ncbi:MAG: sialidase family protein [Fuerstiella sp.]|nr:sialidase family protein [Fuerstiella sp.]